jgi:hypothetical protein
LRVIARVDFAGARRDVLDAHPEWFCRDRDGQVVGSGRYSRTCPVGEYQNSAFAHPVLTEILDRYDVDGFHVNAGGFGGFCCCDCCQAAFGRPIPMGPEAGQDAWRDYLRWRRQAIAEQFAGYYDVMRGMKSDVFFMAELAGQEHPGWAFHNAHHLPSLADSFSQILVTTGGVRSARSSRLWVGMSADCVRAAGAQPIINIKAQMRDAGVPLTMMPPAEFDFYAAAAIAHGAGLKLPTFGIPEFQSDPRAVPAVAGALGAMEQLADVLDTQEPFAKVGLVWPEEAIFLAQSAGRSPEPAAEEFVGAYTALKSRHVQFRVLYDELLSPQQLEGLDAVLVPTAVGLTDAQGEALIDFAGDGGRVVLCEADVAMPLPSPLAELLGADPGADPIAPPYAQRALDGPAWLAEAGPLPLREPCRKVTPPADADIWMHAASPTGKGIPEDIGREESTGEAALLKLTVGKGNLIYCAGAPGREVVAMGHIDHAQLLCGMLLDDDDALAGIVTDAPCCIDVQVMRWSGGVAIHLVNATGPAPLDRITPVGPIVMTVPFDDRAEATFLQPAHAPIPVPSERTAEGIRLSVPKLGAYGLVLLGR